jgi:hypothetical protein
MTLHSLLRLATAFLLSSDLYAQFTPGILANDSYWSDGKAEFDIYDAQLMRGGQARHCEVLHIFAREQIDAKTFARIENPKPGDGISGVRMHQIWSAPIGMFVEQGSLTAEWSADATLLKLNFVGTDSVGNVAKRLQKKENTSELLFDTYRDGAGNVPISPPSNAVWFDELPLRVRTIDFRKPPGEFEIAVAPSIIRLARSESISFTPGKASWKPADKTIEVIVRYANGTDRFLLDREFPFLLREWSAADGSKLKLKRGLKADYWHYNKNGDRERALSNPMLQHPD